HFRTGECAIGEFLSGGANDSCDRERKQNSDHTGRTQTMRGAGVLFVDRAAEADKAPERQRDFSVRAGHKINDRTNLADRERKSAPRGLGKEHLPAFAPAQLRDALAEQW